MRHGLNCYRDPAGLAALAATLLLLVSCGKGAPLGETFLEVRGEAQAELDQTRAAFVVTSAAYDKALDAKAITAEQYQLWRTFFLAEYRPAMTRAIQDLNSAQNRSELDLVTPTFRDMRRKLDGLKIQLDAILSRRGARLWV